MALIEPQSYISIPPGLIYGESDLGDLYQPLLQIVGWMWVTKWWQGRGKGLYTSVAELAGRWGIAERSVYHRMQVYREQGYLDTEFLGEGRVRLSLGPRALDNRPREAATTDNMQSESAHTRPREAVTDNTQGEPANTRPREAAISCNPVARNPQSRASGLHEAPINSVCSSSLSIHEQEKLQLLQTNRVRPREARELAQDPWVTVERIQGWAAALQQDPSVRSLGAVLCANLREHWDPPGPEPEDSGVKRFISGEYAEFIQH